MITIIAISQCKLLQRAGLWMWHTSNGSATPTFHKYIEMVIWQIVQYQHST